MPLPITTTQKLDIRNVFVKRIWRALQLLLALIVLAGCTTGARMSDPATRATLIAGAPTVTLRPNETPRPTQPPRLPTPNLPLATPYATARPAGDYFESVEMGFRVRHPLGWSRSSGAVPGTIVQLGNKPNDVFVLILRTPIEADQSLQSAAEELHALVADWIGELEPVSSEAATLASGVAAWRSEHRRDYPEYGVAVETLIESLAHGSQLITLAAYAEDRHLALERQTVEQIFGGVELFEPTVYGVPRSETYVYAEQEATSAAANDPALGQGDRRVFSGLVSLDPQLALQPELAESWQISADNSVYTFFLRPNATFHDGRPVTAQDVAYSWERALDPATGSNTALTYLGDVVGAAERQRGEAPSVSGLRVIDERTLEVTIDEPKPYFLLKLTASPAMVVDRANVQQGREWYRQPNGTGAYRLLRWQPGLVKLYERNAHFWGVAPSIRYLAARLDVGYSGSYLYSLGELDALPLDGRQLAAARAEDTGLAAELRETVPLCTSFVAFDTSKPPFDDPQVRQAFALAVDRQRYQERAEQGASLPARGLFPPGMPGYDAEFAGVPFDPEQARLRLAESRYGSGAELPPIVLTSSGYGFWVEPGVGVLVQMWQENLGATISIEQLEPSGFAETVQGSGRGNLFFWQWCADYPDPENMADALFHSGAQQNIGRYGNPALDALLEQARVEPELEQRLQLYREAEAAIVGDGAAIFLGHRIDTLLVAPRIQGPIGAPGTVPVERYLSIEAKP